jgi:hypothetical protein
VVLSAGGIITVVSGAGAGAVASGTGFTVVTLSFLLQAVMETANRAARRTEYFIYLPFTNNIKTHTRNRSGT